jgi:glutathione synthase/RimK-type ligase-like ATP-grasp enzyme
MKNNKIILLTGNYNFFGQTRKPWVSMDANTLQQSIREQGFDVEKYSFHEIFNQNPHIRNSIIFYTFSQKINRRDYSKDVVYYLNNGSNILIPSYDLLLCHENKGFQELLKKRINLLSLNSYYFSSIEEISNYPIQFPIVLKTVDTSNGKGVFLVESQNDLLKIVKKLERQNVFTRLDLIRRKYFRRKKSYEHYPDYSNRKDYYQYKDYILKEKNFILQEFVPGLNHDYRVLIFYDKYYVMRRYTKRNDFRASGTKIQEYDIEFDNSLLDYAKEVYDKFDSPFLSLDIGLHQNKYYLFEFQALHFGINALIKSVGYYTYNDENWNLNRHQGSPEIETEIANALVKYLRARYQD